MAEQVSSQDYDCLVLSGGGAKGAYGAGVAKAVDALRRLRGVARPMLYVGASAGALNAYILASGNADGLIEFWRRLHAQDILGAESSSAKRRAFLRWASRWLRPGQPYSVFDNVALRRLVASEAKLDHLHSDLVIAATDYTRGQARAFFRSPLIEEFIAEDWPQIPRRRRLGHLRSLDTDSQLVDALVSSAAIPVIFPPVQITSSGPDGPETSWFIDGGVGNNTPTREAAYFTRFLTESGRGRMINAYCVKLDPPAPVQDGDKSLDLIAIIQRTMDVYSWIHMKPIVDGWNRINREVEDQNQKVSEVTKWLEELPLDPDARSRISDRIRADFTKLGGRKPRVSVPLIEIGPSVPLGDMLDFSPAKAEQHIRHGYNDALDVFRNRQDPATPGETLLDEAEHTSLGNRPLW